MFLENEYSHCRASMRENTIEAACMCGHVWLVDPGAPMSPAATMDVDTARESLLQAADAAFFDRGIGAVTMAEIRDSSGVSLRKMYNLYPAKAGLVAAWLGYRHEQWLAWFETEIDTRCSLGASPLDAALDALGEWLTATNYRGCAFINTLAETTDLSDEHRELVRDHKQAVVDALAGYTNDPAAAALVLDGVIVRCSIFGTTEPVEDARRIFTALGPATATADERHESPADVPS